MSERHSPVGMCITRSTASAGPPHTAILSLALSHRTGDSPGSSRMRGGLNKAVSALCVRMSCATRVQRWGVCGDNDDGSSPHLEMSTLASCETFDTVARSGITCFCVSCAHNVRGVHAWCTKGCVQFSMLGVYVYMPM